MNCRTTLVAGLAVATFLVGCGNREGQDKPATQTAARVNKEEITVHQINAVLQQQRGLKPEQAEQAGRQVLERLIDQELAVQKSAELKIDRDPRVVQSVEAARREIIARAYVEKISEGAAKPTPAEIKKYYDDNPGLFRDRRIYQLQEIAIQTTPDQVEPLRNRLRSSKNLAEFVQYLDANGIKYAGSQAVRAAEQIPLAALPALMKMKDGQAVISTTPTGVLVVALAGSRPQPVDEARAAPAIEQFLLNERKRKVVADDLKALRGAATVSYAGKYAASAPAPTEPARAPTAADVAASAAATIDARSITDGLGIKAATGAASAAEAADAAVRPASDIDASAVNKGLGLK